MSWQSSAMEQQASNYLQRKEWIKAAELYNELLLNKRLSRDRVIACLLGRSECFLELGQHETVIADCRKILKFLTDVNECTSASGTLTRTRLVQSLFALQRYSDAEVTIRDCLTLDKNLDIPKLLESLHMAMSESQQKVLIENELQALSTKLSSKHEMKSEVPIPQQTEILPSCAYCNIAFQNKSELRAHCQTEAHQTMIMSDEGRDWYCRPPPRGMNAEAYTECKYWGEKGSCRFGKQCTEAHGADELTEWKQRYKYRQMKLQRACEKELFGKSYMEELLEKCMQCSNPTAIMAEKIDEVDDSCCSNLVTTVLSKSSTKQWTFTLKARRPLHAVALLHDAHRSYYEITRILVVNGQVVTDHVIGNNQEWVLPENWEGTGTQYEVTVTFKTDIYGTFRQAVVFDFNSEPILLKNLCVDVIPTEEAQKINEIRQEISLTAGERWTNLNSHIVPFTERSVENEWTRRLLDLYSCPQGDKFTLSHVTVSDEKLTRNNYRVRMHELLHIEEMARNEQVNKFNLTAQLHVVDSYLLLSSSLSSSTAKYSNFGELYAFIKLSQDLSEDTLCGRLILSNCNTVLIGVDRPAQDKPTVYEALIEDKGKNIIYLRLSAITVKDLNLKPDNLFEAQVQFHLNRIPYCEWHYAVDRMSNLKLIFPDTYLEPQIPWSPQKQWSDKIDSRLNLKQKEAVIAITTPVYVPLPPILIIGPFGTGKTFTLAQAIKQLMTQDETRVLICTHSNSAADLYIKDYLHPYVQEGHSEARPLRIYYQKRWVTTVHPTVQEYCLIKEHSNVRTFEAPTIADIKKHRIVVVTLSTSMYLSNIGLPQGYFTHILLDEAAQTIECEAIMPLSLANQNTRIVLAGDHMQLSPELFSKFAKERNLHISLLERLYDHYPATFPCKILLCENYRAHEAIIEFTSELFYEQKLISSGKQPKHHVLYPLTFFTAKGEDIQDVNSTAFYNTAEAYEIVERVSHLKQNWPATWGQFDEQSVGIMTPYSDQVFRIRTELRKRCLGNISVERVLNVQGKQFRAVFLSTVRTRRTCTGTTDENDYGFLSNSKLLNTAITRAQSLVAVVGDPVALCSVGRCSKVWEKFISVCANNNSLVGITRSYLKNQLDGLELKKTYGLNPLAPEFVPRKFKNETYIRYPNYSAPYVTYPTVIGPSPSFYRMEQQVQSQPAPPPPPQLGWPVYQPMNYMWRFSSGQPPFNVVLNLGKNENAQKSNGPQSSSSSSSSSQKISITKEENPKKGALMIQQTTIAGNLPPPERDLIQFLDNVHIPQTFKSNSGDSLNDLMNLLPENMSLAHILMQPSSFHNQWYNYLLVKKGFEAAKKFEYLILMSTKRGQRNMPVTEPSVQLGKSDASNWTSVAASRILRDLRDDRNAINTQNSNFCHVPYLEQQTPDLNWFDEPINQINFDKPVYLKDLLSVAAGGVQQQRVADNINTMNGVSMWFNKKESIPLYQRRSSSLNHCPNQKGD